MDDNVIRFPKGPYGLVSLRDLPEPPPVTPWYAGYPEFRHKMQFAPGMLSVVTGHPGHGKTSLMAQLWFNMASIHDLHVTVASFESSPMPAYRKMVRQFWAGLPQAQMTDEQIRAADAFIDDHYKFLIDEYDSPTLDWIYDKIFDRGNKPNVLVIDPWNRIESKRQKDQTETDYILRSLIDLRVFAKDNNCHVQIIAHPAKRDIRYREYSPILEDIAGSKHWDNIPDQGFCVHRPEFVDEAGNRRFDVELYHLKSRFEEIGWPCQFDMRFNPRTGRFEMGDTSV